jgi:hypothetical protein
MSNMLNRQVCELIVGAAVSGTAVSSKMLTRRGLLAALCLIVSIATLNTRASADSVTSAQAQRIVSQVSSLISSPGSCCSNEAPSGGALLGNGNVGVVIVNPINTMTFLLGKNEFWSLAGGQVEPMASMALSIPGMSGASFAMQENIYTGTVTGQFTLNGNQIQTTSWVSFNDTTNNLLFTEFTYSGSGAQAVTVSLAAGNGNTYPTSSGSSGSVLYRDVAADSTSAVGGYNTHQVRVAVGVVGATGTISGGTLQFTLSPGTTVTLVSSIMSNYDSSSYTTQSISNVSGSTGSSVSSELSSSEASWASFWAASYVEFDNNQALQDEYYGSLYVLACSSEPNTLPPGLWGPWVETNPAWAGDYTLDYNYQTPPLAEFPTNHVALAASYDTPVEAWLPNAESYATSRGFTGAYWPTHIGPLPNGSYETSSGDLNIKSNGAFAAAVMLEHYYVTQDANYAAAIWPVISQTTTFYQNYLTFNGTTYDDLNDSQVENDPYPQTNGTMSLGFYRGLFQGAITLSTVLNENSTQRAAWQNILNNLTTFNGLTSTTGGLPYPTMNRGGLTVLANEQIGDMWAANGDEVWGIVSSGAIGLGSSSTLLTIARNTVTSLGPQALQVMWYPAAARVGTSPSYILSNLNSFVQQHLEQNLYLNVNGGGIENAELVPATISEMMMQSFQGNIILFPNWPSWTTAHFGDNLAYGNFLVSSAISSNKVVYARIISQAGQTVSITNPWPGQSAQFYRNGTNQGTLSGTTFSIPTSTNDVLLLAPSGRSYATITSELGETIADIGGNNGPGSVLPYNVHAIYTNGTSFSTGGADGHGSALSATVLGATQAFNGTAFTYGPSNALDAFSDQTVALIPGSFSSLNILAFAVNGSQASQTFEVNYTNGTYSTVTQSISDWCSPQGYSGETQVVTMTYRNTSTGGEVSTPTCYVYGYTIPVTSNLTVESVTLPVNDNVIVLGIQDEQTVPEASPTGAPQAVPGTVQAENYDTGGPQVGYFVGSVNGTADGYRSDGVDLEQTSDTGGGYDVGWTNSGQWFRYTVNVATAGAYTVSFRVAGGSSTDAFRLSDANGNNLSGPVNVPATGGYQNWTTVTATVTLPAGQQVLTLNQDNCCWNINWLSFALATAGEAPYGGTAASVPGAVQAENYDTGGSGLGYHVNSVNGTGNSYRTDGVDLEQTSDTGGGSDLGWTSSGQWFNYTVNVATAGVYAVGFRIADPSAVTGAFHLSDSLGNNLTGPINLPSTGGWQTWTTVWATLELSAGVQTLTLNQDNGGWNVNWMAFGNVPFNVNAIYTNGTTFLSNGGADQHGNATSATLLGPATTWNGTTFIYGPTNQPSGSSNLTIPLIPGLFSSLNMLAFSWGGGQASQTFTINYSDGTHTVDTQSVSDWCTSSNYTGETKVVTMSYLDTAGGGQTTNYGTCYIYGYTLAANNTKTVASITLPANSQINVLGVQDEYSQTIGVPYNVPAIYQNGVVFPSNGGADQHGNALSSTLLGSGTTWNGTTFTYGPPNTASGMSNVTIPLWPGSFASLNVLAFAWGGGQGSQTFTINYTDGTHTTDTQSVSDWCTSSNYTGETKVVTMSYLNGNAGLERSFGTCYVYGYTLVANSSKTVKNIQIPANSQVVVLGVQDQQ